MKSITEILQGIRPEFDFSTSEDFFEDGMLDSFDLMVLVSELESTYGIHLDGIEIVPGSFRNIEAIRALLARHGVQA